MTAACCGATNVRECAAYDCSHPPNHYTAGHLSHQQERPVRNYRFSRWPAPSHPDSRSKPRAVVGINRNTPLVCGEQRRKHTMKRNKKKRQRNNPKFTAHRRAAVEKQLQIMTMDELSRISGVSTTTISTWLRSDPEAPARMRSTCWRRVDRIVRADEQSGLTLNLREAQPTRPAPIPPTAPAVSRQQDMEDFLCQEAFMCEPDDLYTTMLAWCVESVVAECANRTMNLYSRFGISVGGQV